MDKLSLVFLISSPFNVMAVDNDTLTQNNQGTGYYFKLNDDAPILAANWTFSGVNSYSESH